MITLRKNHNTTHDRGAKSLRTLPMEQPILIIGAIVILLGIAIAMVIVSQPRSTIPANFEPEVYGAPGLVLRSDAVVDHGDVPVGQMVETTFQVQNVGDEILTILAEPQIEVVAGCCAPRVAADDYELLPGEITTIRTSFTMYPGMDGPHDFRIHVLTNDPTQPDTQLTILSNWIS